MARYEFPTTAELLEMGEPRENAVTVYRRRQLAISSWRDHGQELNGRGHPHAARSRGESRAPEAFAARTAEILADECWHKLSRSLAIFTTDETAEVFVLPNNLEHQIQVSRYFDLGQFLRAVATPQDAYALSLSGRSGISGAPVAPPGPRDRRRP